MNWSIHLPFEVNFVLGAPTAASGIVYAGGGGTSQLFAVRGSSGRVLWSRHVGQGDSSPAVDAQGVYVDYVCQHAYAFTPLSGNPLWSYAGACTGGGGRTPVLADGKVFAREATVGDDLLFSASSGALLGSFTADPAPAVAGGVAFILADSTLKAIAGSGQGAKAWQFTGDGTLTSAPLVVGGLVFAGARSGALYALDSAAGTTSWSTNVGAAIPAPEEDAIAQPLTGLGAANGTLVVPAGNQLIAYRAAGAITQAPASVSAPTIDGAPNPSERLAADVGIWSGLPSAYAYQWQRCDGAGTGCSDIAGATGASLHPTAAQVGSMVRVRIVATNANGASGAVASGAVAVVAAAPVNETPPAIVGNARAGETLTADVGTWIGEPSSYEYRWRRCLSFEPECSDIPGATGSTYDVTEDDVNHQIQLRLLATNAVGDSEPVDSARTGDVVPALPAAPVNLSPPTYDGIPDEGELLTADPGTWTANPTSFRYQWFSCDATVTSCPDITGATNRTYVVRSTDVGRYIGVDVVATNVVGDSEPADSDVFGPVHTAPPFALTPPSITGTAQVGGTLTATAGEWTGAPTSFSFQWYSCDAPLDTCDLIASATAPTILVAAQLVGRRLGVGVIASNAGGDSYEEFSLATDVVAPAAAAPIALAPPAAAPIALAPPAAPQPLPLPLPQPAVSALKVRARADGSLAVTARLREAGRLTAVATAPSASLARNRPVPCGRRCRSARAAYGKGSTRATKPRAVLIVVRPNLRARRALARHALAVRVDVTLTATNGGAPTKQRRALIVRRPKHRPAARAQRPADSRASRLPSPHS